MELGNFDGLNKNVPHWLPYLHTWSSVLGAIWTGCGTVRQCSIIGGSASLRLALRIHSIARFLSLHSASCLWLRHDLSASYSGCLLPDLHHPLWNHKPKGTLPSTVTFGRGIFIIETEKQPM